jgi:hypothetical protein
MVCKKMNVCKENTENIDIVLYNGLVRHGIQSNNHFNNKIIEFKITLNK